MKTRTLLSSLLIGGVLAGAAVPMVAAAGPHARGPGIAARLMHVADEIGLTDEQKTQIKGILEANKPAAQALRQDMRATSKSLNEAIESGADNDTIAGLAVEAHSLRGEARAMKQDVRKEVGAVLTPEQKEQLKQLRSERRGEGKGKGRGGRGKRGGGGGFGDL